MSMSSSQSPAKITRRGLLSAGSALAVAALVHWPQNVAAAGLDPAGFLDLSQRLTGRDALDEDIAGRMLEAFQAAGQGDAIAALANGEENAEAANAVVAAWYSGVSPDPASATAVTYTDALMWEAMDYTKPMGMCGGQMGYWADPPEA